MVEIDVSPYDELIRLCGEMQTYTKLFPRYDEFQCILKAVGKESIDLLLITALEKQLIFGIKDFLTFDVFFKELCDNLERKNFKKTLRVDKSTADGTILVYQDVSGYISTILRNQINTSEEAKYMLKEMFESLDLKQYL